MAYSQSDLDKLQSALASGALKVEYNDRIVHFRSIKELKEAIQIVKKDLGLVKRSSRILCAGSKGTV